MRSVKKTKKNPGRKISYKTLTISIISAVLLISFYNIFSVTSKKENLSVNIEIKPSVHKSSIDFQLSQYSDQHITKNAIDTNPKFSEITFENISEKNSFFSDQVAMVGKALKSLVAQNTPEHTGPKEFGTWIWTPVMDMTPDYIDSIIGGAQKNGINTMYMSVDSYLDIYTLPDSPDKESKKKAFSDKLEYFITKAKDKGIAVDAEAGWRNWAEDGNAYKAYAIVDFIKQFNLTHENKFRGFQYDVEPYLLDTYQDDKATVLKHYVALVDQTEKLIDTNPLRFSVVVPDFYDEKDGATPDFEYGEKVASVFTHLLDILDKKENSSIVIMSYRNFALGDDSSVDVSKNEMATAIAGKYSTRLIIAQETGDVPPPYITYYNTNKKYLTKQLKRINMAFDSYPNFGGIAVHYVNAFLSLK